MTAVSGRRLSAAISIGLLSLLATRADASTGTCDVSTGDYTAYTGADPIKDVSPPATTPGLSGARCMKTIRTLGTVVEGVFRDGKGRYADELTTYGKLFNMHAGEAWTGVGQVCSPGVNAKGSRNAPGGYSCVTTVLPTFGVVGAAVNKLDWVWSQGPRYTPTGRVWCADLSQGCFGGRCYDSECVKADGTLTTCAAGQICKKGACVVGDPATLPTCTTLDTKPFIGDGDTTQYNPWDALVFDLGGLANKVAIFAMNDHGPQPCESNEYTVFLTNNPYSREIVDNPLKTGADPSKWNRAKLFKLYTHGWIDNPDCCDSPKTCDPTKCTLPKAGDAPVLESDSMTLVFSLPCGIAFRYAATISGYDGKSLTDTGTVDACEFHSFDNEVDAVAGLNDDESALCPDKDGDGFPTCDCAKAPCDCIDDPAINPDAKKYHPGAAQACDGPEYSCAPTPCPPGTYCYTHQCLAPCKPGEFKCSGGFMCTKADSDAGALPDLCVPSACGDAGVCDPGKLCIDGKCLDPCDPPTKCPFGEVCQDGKCTNLCALIKCPAGQTCQSGVCHDNCACLAKSATSYPCEGDLPLCDPKTGLCAPSGCDAVSCPVGKHCEAGGVCKGPCEGVVCPFGSSCVDGKGCVGKCDSVTCPAGQLCDPRDGSCVDDGCEKLSCPEPTVCKAGKCVDTSSEICLSCDTGSTGFDSSTDPDAGDATIGDNPAADSTATGGCGCVTVGSRGLGAGLGLGAVVFLAGAVVRRRRKRRSVVDNR